MPNIVDQILQRARGKTLADLHPDVKDREHVMSVRSDGAGMSAPYSYWSAIEDYESHVWVRKAINKISDNFSPLPLTVRRGTVGKDVQVDNHPLLELLTNINGQMTSVELWQQWCTDLLLGGEEGWELVKGSRGGYVEIWPRQPHVINVRPDPQRLRYFNVAEYIIDDTIGEPYRLPPDELLHFKFFNPRNPWRGIAPITAIRMSIAIDVYAQAWQKMFYRNSTRPDMAVIAPEGLTPDERSDIEKKLMQEHGGVGNAWKPIVLEQGVSDIKVFSFPPKDLEWVSQREMSREEIGAMFGVPDEIMGWGRDTYENFSAALRVFWLLTLVPLTGFRDTSLTEYFQRVKMLRPDERVVTDLSGIAVLRENDGDEWTRAQGQIDRGALLINEWRGAHGLKPVPWGNQWWAPFNLAPIGSTPPEPAPAKRIKSYPEYASAEHERVLDVHLKRIDPFERKFKKLVTDLFDEQREAVTAELRQATKAKRTRQQIADDPFDLDEWTATFEKRAKPLIRDIVSQAGQSALADLNIGLRFDVERPEVADFIRARVQRFAQPVNETTWNELRASLGEGFDAGEGVDKLMARVEQVMGDRITSSAETIARTETAGATSGGTIEAWDQSEVVSGKTWISALIQGRSRQEHMDAHGQTVGLRDQFDIDGVMTDGPGLSGDAATDINCLCTVIAVVDEKSLKAAVPARRNGHSQERVNV